MKIVGCLQNAWFKPKVTEERARDPKFWYAAFRLSFTGRKLYTLWPEYFKEMLWENASPQIGRVSTAKFPADHEHIRAWLAKHEPQIVVAFGKVAEEALRELWAGHLLAVPHPAYMLLQNQTLIAAKAHFKVMERSSTPIRVGVRQIRGTYQEDSL